MLTTSHFDHLTTKLNHDQPASPNEQTSAIIENPSNAADEAVCKYDSKVYSTNNDSVFDHTPPTLLKKYFVDASPENNELKTTAETIVADIYDYLKAETEDNDWEKTLVMERCTKTLKQCNLDDYISIKESVLETLGDDYTARVIMGWLLTPLQKQIIADTVSNNRHFEGFDIDENIHRLLIDGNRQTTDGDEFVFDEKEPGYFTAMLDGLTAMLKSCNEKLTTKMLEELHDICVSNVLSVEGEYGTLFLTGFRNDTGFFYIDLEAGKNFNEQGIEAFKTNNPDSIAFCDNQTDMINNHLEDIKNKQISWFIDNNIDNSSTEHNPAPKLVICARTRSDSINYIDTVLNTYHDTIATTTRATNGIVDENKIIEAIAKCCQSLNQYHPFADGNIRTFTFLTMNKLLLQQDMSPAILDDPNVFDGYDINTLVEKIKAGQDQFKSYKSG